MIIKILLSILVITIPGLQLYRDWKFSDKRTNKYKIFTKILFISFFFLIILTAYQIWIDDKSSNQTISKIDNISSNQDSLVNDNRLLKVKSDNCFESNKRMIEEIQSYKKQIEERNQRIKILEENVQLAKKGAVVSYDLIGNRRESSGPGMINFIDNTPENAAYRELSLLQDNRNFAEIIKLCNQWIKRNPNWHTPFVFRGVAYANLGKKDLAIMDWEYAIKFNDNDPEYDKIKELLRKIKQEK